MYKRISDYGLIGNLGSCALVGLDGSIDWCCLPHLDSPAVFCALLDARKGGHFKIAPQGGYQSSQAYLEGTNILVTTFTGPQGVCTVTDFMPFFGTDEDQQRPVIYRIVEGREGMVPLEIAFSPRFDYARARTELTLGRASPAPTVPPSPDKVGALLAAPFHVIAQGNGASAGLATNTSLEIKDHTARAIPQVKAGERIVFVFGFGNSTPSLSDAAAALDATTKGWREWVHRCEEKVCVFGGPWHDRVVRSALALKLLTHGHTGSMAAAATASLPEQIGGVRNWDYRFTWVRDASFTVQALHNLGHRREAEDFLKWAQQVLSQHPDPSLIRIMYGLHGETNLDEVELTHLEGYRGSQPVRIGNGAALQRQLDIYGELMDAAYQLTRYGGTIDATHWPFLRTLADYVCLIWKEKDAGIWEVRGGDRHFVYSKVMCWVALDRAVRISRTLGLPGDRVGWDREAEAIRNAVLQEGYNEKVGAFVQSFGSDVLDASNLLIPLVGFLPFEDPRVQNTINATLRGLSDGPLVHRYKADDGLPGSEGAFLLCSFWLTDCLTLSGRADEAREIFLELTKYANHLGLYAEEVEPETGDLLGNFPQAFTHIGFINSALYLGRAAGKLQMGPSPMGVKE